MLGKLCYQLGITEHLPVTPKEREVSTQLVHQVTVTAQGNSGGCSGYPETKERISGFLSTSQLKSLLWGSTWHWHRALTPCSHHESNIYLIILIGVL